MNNVSWTAGLKGTPFDPQYIVMILITAAVIWVIDKLFNNRK